MILTPNEVVALTQRKHHSAQQRVLRFMCVDHCIRPDGSLVVLKEHVNELMGGAPESRIAVAKQPEPNWSAM